MGKRVLIADDDPLIRSVLSDGLTEQGYEVSLAADGLEAWLRIQVAPPDCLVLDLVMPRLDGIRLCRYVKTDPRLADMRVFVLTATAAEAGGLSDLGADRVLAKRGASEMIAELLQAIRATAGGEEILPYPVAITADVHPRRIVSELLAETAHLRAILKHLSEGILLLDETGRVLFVNPAGERLLGISERSLIGRSLAEVVGPPWGERLAGAVRQLGASPAKPQLQEQILHKGRSLHVTATPLRDATGGISHLLLLRDVTSYMQRIQELTSLIDLATLFTSALEVEQLLARVLERVRTAMQVEAGAVLLVDPEGRELVFRAAVGDCADQVGGLRIPLDRGIAGWVCSEGVPVIVPDVQRDPRFNPAVDARTGFSTRSMLCVPLRVRETVIGAIQVMHAQADRSFAPEDLNFLFAVAGQTAAALESARLFAELSDSYVRLRQAQNELVRTEKLRALGQMGAGIAHDLNNMLAAVLGQTELLKLRASDPAVREALHVLETAATDGAEVIRRLQDFSRQQPLAPRATCDLRRLVEEAVALTRPRWGEEARPQGQPIAVHIQIPTLPPIQARVSDVREVLMNLILNATDAMPEGGSIRFAARVIGGAGERGSGRQDPTEPDASPDRSATPWPLRVLVELDVSDTGVGMTEEVCQRLFDPFFTTKGVRGTGLGLSVVYGTMERNGGSVRVVSSPGQGTTFTLRFQAAPMGVEEPVAAEEAAIVPRTLLFIDDDRSVRRTLAELLRAAGHVVVEEESGTGGLERLAELTPDLVITDLGMPDMTGWDVARTVKERSPQVPIVLLTGWGDQRSVEEEGAGLVEQVLCKPVRLEQLLRVIERLTAFPGGLFRQKEGNQAP